MSKYHLADQAGVPWLDFLLNHSWLVFLLIMMLISPLGPMYIFKPVVDGVFPRWSDMWLSFRFDMALAAGGAALVYYCNTYVPAEFRMARWIGPTIVGVLAVGGLMYALIHMAAERGKVAHDNPGSMYHNFVLCSLLLVMMGLPLIVTLHHLWWDAPDGRGKIVGWCAVGVFVMAIAAWQFAGRYDDQHQTNADGVSKHLLAHRSDWHNLGKPGYYDDLLPSLKYALHLPTDYRPTTH